MKTFITFVCATLALIQSAFAQSATVPPEPPCNDATITVVAQHVRLPDFKLRAQDGKIIAADCKTASNNRNQLIAAFAYDAGIESEKLLILAIIDKSTGNVAASLNHAFKEDAGMNIGFSNSLQIDTAKYDIAKGVRAFGLDITSGMISRCSHSGGFGPMRMLFVQRGDKISVILDSFYLSTWHLLDMAHSCNVQDGATVNREYFNNYIGISKNVTNGYANLRITATSLRDDGVRVKRKPFAYELKYDGRAYQYGDYDAVRSKWEGPW